MKPIGIEAGLMMGFPRLNDCQGKPILRDSNRRTGSLTLLRQGSIAISTPAIAGGEISDLHLRSTSQLRRETPPAIRAG
ncbi:MAG: hypothetical protein CVU57_23145 [Deltaproteobacteria bacterium HGW-Deltaproteobacteria-15]|nr:MAG: hypothetical protein CVU57_23145 [Deltaproteobacteria bacterium HGW-Deltaproteobacteria-15]